MEPGGVFCLRSMTKAVVGTAVQMLIDEDRLHARAAVALLLPSFDNERSRAITVEQLLTHTSGLPLSSLIGQDLAALGGERAIADLTGGKGPEFPPGTRYQYSDDGADVLGALVEATTGEALEEFLRERLFEPLGMRETTGVMALDHPLRPRVCSNYLGSPGSWARYWSPADPPLFPFLLGSQGLYGSVLDYARFLHLWKEKGRAGGKRLLSMRAVRHALEPANRSSTPSCFEDTEARYGRMMQLWVDPAAEEGAPPFAFGHGGSDGTIAWVFPALDLVVLYFTQSRNSLTVIELGQEVQHLLIDPLTGAERAPAVSYSPDELAGFAGLFWEEDDQEYQAVLRRGQGLWVELPGKALRELVPTPRRDVFELALSPDLRLEFERSDEGRVVAFTGVRGDKRERMPRLVPAADLPALDELLAKKRSASDWSAIEALGGVRASSSVEIESAKVHGTSRALFRGLASLRTEGEYGALRETLVLREGRAWSWDSRFGLEELAGAPLVRARLDHPLLPVADWRELYERIVVLARVERAGAPAFLVRAEPAGGNAHTWTLSAETGLPLELLSVDPLARLGEIGRRSEYGDWRAVGGLKLPFHERATYATPLLGTIDVRVEAVETGLELPAAAFAIPAEVQADER